MRNEYGELIEEWKVKLVVARAQRKNFRKDELEDVQQEIVPVILKFRYDVAKSNGASEKTALTALIDHQLAQIQRSNARQQKNNNKFRQEWGQKEEDLIRNRIRDARYPSLALKLDLQEALARLTTQEQEICRRLSHGENRFSITKALGLGRYETDQLFEHIRDHFKSCGLDLWARNA